MTAFKGSLILIKAGNGGEPESFSTIGGLRMSEMVLNNRLMDASTLESGAWRALAAEAGLRRMHIAGTGIFTDNAAEELVRAQAFAGSIGNYRFVFANGDYVSGPFLVASYMRKGVVDSAESYMLAMESAGTVIFVAA